MIKEKLISITNISLSMLLETLKSQNLKLKIPVIQRNYKWSEATAVEFLKNYIVSFENQDKKVFIGTISTYFNKIEVQLIDGQQRVITLNIILQLLKNKLDKKNLELDIPLIFERDEKIDFEMSRLYFLQYLGEYPFDENIIELEEKAMKSVDLTRIYNNARRINDELRNYNISELEGLYKYILLSTVFLYNETMSPPIVEFLNLNKLKTRFSVFDRVRNHILLELDTVNTSKKILPKYNRLEKYDDKIALFLSELNELSELIYSSRFYLNYEFKERAKREVKDNNLLNLLYANVQAINIETNNICLTTKEEICRIELYINLLSLLESEYADRIVTALTGEDNTFFHRLNKFNINKKSNLKDSKLDILMKKYFSRYENIKFLYNVEQYKEVNMCASDKEQTQKYLSKISGMIFNSEDNK